MAVTSFDNRADTRLAGSALRNEAAGYLEAIHGNARLEIMIDAKKVDIVCEVREYGKTTSLFVEAKDYDAHLSRQDVALILADYGGMIGQGKSSRLLIVTRRGLSPSAQGLIESHVNAFHQTIWELEDNALGLLPYVKDQLRAFDSEGLRAYYIPARAYVARYNEEHLRSLEQPDIDLFEAVQTWLDEPSPPPLAILGGYGAGKSSFAKRLISHQAEIALTDPAARRPVLIKLGNITRSTSLDSLLGSLFTSEYEVRGYSFRRFNELNAKGRLLIILDGFDEMKHAMTWTEFRNEIEELNALNEGDSRIILLGRPSAFTSDDEHLEVLRGRRRIGGSTRRLHDWPEFREYELAPFTPPERRNFVTNYLMMMEVERSRRAGKPLDRNAVARRAAEVNALADQEDEVFGKPVHARILVELALDPEFDLQSFAAGVTRWTLYAEFFALLARRETKKPARSPIEASFRLEFLRRVAMWLWQAREGTTSFRATDLPPLIFENLPEGDADTIEDKRREYLAGAFLERKAADTFFFPHRSFAEFLVAEHLAINPPAAHQHEAYDQMARDGVTAFLQAAPRELNVRTWARTLDANSGQLTIDYLGLLERVAGGPERLAAITPESSVWSPLLHVIGTSRHELELRQHHLGEALLKAPERAVALLLSGITRFPDLLCRPVLKPATHPLSDLSAVTAAALITRIVVALRETAAMPRHTIREEAASILKLAQASIAIEQQGESRTILVDWGRLGNEAGLQARGGGTALANDMQRYDYGPLPKVRIPYLTVRNLMPPKRSGMFHQMVLRRCTMKTITVVTQTGRRR